ncbi:MAG TPA: GAF domain-containing protein [Solirubrobacterales bacterium]|nr:GAF domain-containing protein [Solirubrobacterales bacterium]
MTEEPLETAVAASALAGEEAHEELLRSIVEVARAVFEAKATSITTYDEETDELIFRAATGDSSSALIGRRFPSGAGLTGFVLRTREPLVLDDVAGDPRFARDIAESTGYLPKALMAAPLLRGERALGVLTVLDRPSERPFRMAEMELLVLVARQGAIALDVVERARGARATLAREGEAATLARLAGTLDRLDPDRREPALRLLGALERILTGSP